MSERAGEHESPCPDSAAGLQDSTDGQPRTVRHPERRRYRRGVEPPNPHLIASVLREQLTSLRKLIALSPDSREYPIAAELVTRALRQLDKCATTSAP